MKGDVPSLPYWPRSSSLDLSVRVRTGHTFRGADETPPFGPGAAPAQWLARLELRPAAAWDGGLADLVSPTKTVRAKRAQPELGSGERARLSVRVGGLLGRRDGVCCWRSLPEQTETGLRAHGSNCNGLHRLLGHAVALGSNYGMKPRRPRPGGTKDSHRSWVAAQGPPGTLLRKAAASHRPMCTVG